MSSGRKKFSELRTRMTPDSQARAAIKAAALSQEIDLAEVRRSIQLYTPDNEESDRLTIKVKNSRATFS